MKFTSLLKLFDGQERRAGRSKKSQRKGGRPRLFSRSLFVETMEERLSPAVLAEPTPSGVVANLPLSGGNSSISATANSPAVAMNPNNPLQMVAVYTTFTIPNNLPIATTEIQGAYTTNGGQTWTALTGLPTKLTDPSNTNFLPYAQATDAGVAWDANNNFYLVYSEHSLDQNSGDIRFQKYSFNGATPTNITASTNSLHPDGVLYQWYAASAGVADKALEPFVAVDNNPASFTDIDTSATQSDSLVGMVYIGWNTINTTPGFALDAQGFTQSVIKILGSSNGGQTFTTQVFANSGGNYGGGVNSDGTAVVTMGTISDRPPAAGSVPGGEAAIFWTNTDPTTNSSQILVTRFLNGGASAQFKSAGGSTTIIDAVAPSGGGPHFTFATLKPVSVNITDPNFTTISDVDVTLALTHPSLAELRIRLLGPAKISAPSDITLGYDANSDGNQDVYVTGKTNNQVVVYDGQTGNLIKVVVPANSAGLNGPTSITFGPDVGNGAGAAVPDGFEDIYVTSAAPSSNQVKVYSGKPGATQGTPINVGNGPGVFVTSGSGVSTLSDPEGLAFGADETGDSVPELFVSSSQNNNILVYNGKTGVFIRQAVVGNLTNRLQSPRGLAFGPDGLLYVASFNVNEVCRFDVAPGAAQLEQPSTPASTVVGELRTGPAGSATVAYQALTRKPVIPGTVNGEVRAAVSGAPIYRFTVDAAGNFTFTEVAGTPLLQVTAGAINYNTGVITLTWSADPGATTQILVNYRAHDVATYASGAPLNQPVDVAFGPDGNLYVSSSRNDQILRYNGPIQTDPLVTPGTFLNSFVQTGQGGVKTPTGIVFGPGPELFNTFLYAVSQGNNSIMRYGPVPGVPKPAGADVGPPLDATFTVQTGQPTGLMFYTANPGNPLDVNRILVASFSNNEIDAYDVNGNSLGIFISNQGSAPPIQGPVAIAQTPVAGTPTNIYVVSQNNSSVIQYAFDSITGAWVWSGVDFITPGEGGLSSASAIVFAGSNVFVSSENTNQVIRYDGNGNPNGVVLANPLLIAPRGLAYDAASDTVFVVSSGNNKILKFRSDGTFAGEFGRTTIANEIIPNAGASTNTTYNLSRKPVVPGSVAGSIYNGASGRTLVYTFFDDGLGNLVLTAVGAPSPTVTAGTINYTTGVITLTWSANPGNNAVLANYDVQYPFTDLLNGADSLFFVNSDRTLFVANRSNHKIVRFNATPGVERYLETIVPLGGDQANNGGGLNTPRGVMLDPTTQNLFASSFANDVVARYSGLDAINVPSVDNPGAVFVAPGGSAIAPITLVTNRIDNAGNTINKLEPGPGVIPRGLSGANMGVVIVNNTVTGTFGTTFDDQAGRDITDTNAPNPWIGHFKPEDVGGGLLSSLNGLTPAEVNGTWNLEVTDMRASNQPPQFISFWSIDFTSKMTPTAPTTVANTDVPGTATSAGNGTFPSPGPTTIPDPSPNRGFGPGVAVAVDNTLGSFSPYQGRMYMAYVNNVKDGSTVTDRGNIFLRRSDNGGVTWSAAVRVNDDSSLDIYNSEGTRAQFQPALAVDPVNGTLVISWYDARLDASQVRVSRFFTYSIDGGATFSKQVWVNESNTVIDAITFALTGARIPLESVPDNATKLISPANLMDFGDHQGLVAYGGQAVSVWAGNRNLSATDPVSGNPRPAMRILSTTIKYTLGPRIDSSTQGPVSEPYSTPNSSINTRILPDGTRLADTIDVAFDRPVDPLTFTIADVQVSFRPMTLSATADPDGIFLKVLSVNPLDSGRFGSAGILGATQFRIKFDPFTALNGADQAFLNSFAKTGTYSYAIGPMINDRVRSKVGAVVNNINLMDQNANAVPGQSSGPGTLGDVYAVPRPKDGKAPPFSLPYDPTSLPLIVPGPHLVESHLPGNNGPDPVSVALSWDGSDTAHTFGFGVPPLLAGRLTGTITIGGVLSYSFVDNSAGNLVLIPVGSPSTAITSATVNYGAGTITLNWAAAPGPYVLNVRYFDSSTGGPTNTGSLVLNGMTNKIDVTFDRWMNPLSFTPDDIVRISGPYGQIPLTGVTVTPLGAKTFRITLPQQQFLSGTYTIVLGPNIEDTIGQKLDINLNAGLDVLRGADPANATTQPITHTFPGPSQTITGDSGAGFTDIPLNFNESFVIVGAQVKLNILHSFDPDLEASLISPVGTEVKLFSGVGNSATHANFTNTIFDDDPKWPEIQFAQPPFNGTFNPQEPLSRFLGEGSSGTWILRIKNNGTIDGQLLNWSLTLTQSVPGTGLGEAVSDQTTVSFRIFTMDNLNPLSHQVWTAVGPASTNGNSNSARIGGIAVDPSDPSGNTVYVAGSTGGVWKTTNFLTVDGQGPRWEPLTDFGTVHAINIGGISVFGRNNDPNQSIVFVSTGDGDGGNPGVGFLRSLDGGATWTLLDSTTNVDAQGNPLPINSPARDHALVGTTSFKIVADPTAGPNGKAIVYAALSGANGGIWRTFDGGDHWQKVRGGQATDVALALSSAASQVSGNANILYAGFRGEGVFISQNQGSSWTLMTGGVGNPLIRVDTLNAPATVVTPPADTPNGAKGRISLAVPGLTTIAGANVKIQDLAYQGWLYAVVATPGSRLDGVYVTKDFGQNWTKIQIPERQFDPLDPLSQRPSNDETRPDYDVLASPISSQGNYNQTIAVDPNNPSIVYIGGMASGNPFDILRLNTVGLRDAKAVYQFDNFDNNGGQLVPGPGQGSGPLGLEVSGPTINALRNPNQIFLTNATLLVPTDGTLVGASTPTLPPPFANDGGDSTWLPYSNTGGTDFHRSVVLRDPLTGLTRIIWGNDHGIFTSVDQGNGKLMGSIGSVTDFSFGNGDVRFLNGARSGNLQISQMYFGAAQPSQAAADIAGAFFYGNLQDDGFPVSDRNILNNGNITWAGPEGDGTGIATDQTGSGTAYSFQWPCCGTHIIAGRGSPTDFFGVNPSGALSPSSGNYFSRTFGLFDDGVQNQWPNIAGSNFAVNPINGDQIVMSSQRGRLFRTSTQGLTWFKIGFAPGDPGALASNTLDGVYGQAFAFGAPDPADVTGQTDNFIYFGTDAGNIWVTFDGGASWTKFDTTKGLDGSSVQAIVASPIRGSHEAYAVTTTGVFHIGNSKAAGATWQNITGNLFQLNPHPAFGDANLTTPWLQTPSTSRGALHAVAVDWRYAIPEDVNDPLGPTFSVIYVGGEGGVFRSDDRGANWRIFPKAADPNDATVVHDNAVVDGGYFPLADVRDLDISYGNVNPVTGRPDPLTTPDLLVATTFGRGMFAIRIASSLSAQGKTVHVVEGQAITDLVIGTIKSFLPNAPASSFTITVKWDLGGGNFTTTQGTAVSTSPTTFDILASKPTPYPEAGGPFTLSITVTDGSGNLALATSQLIVDDAPLTGIGINNIPAVTGTSLPATTVIGQFTDANLQAPLSDFSVQVRWAQIANGQSGSPNFTGIMSASIVQTGPGQYDIKSTSASPLFPAEGVYRIELRVNDVDGATTGTFESTVRVSNIVAASQLLTIIEGKRVLSQLVATFTDVVPVAASQYHASIAWNYGGTTRTSVGVITQTGPNSYTIKGSSPTAFTNVGDYTVTIVITKKNSISTATVVSDLTVYDADLVRAGLPLTIKPLTNRIFSGVVAKFRDRNPFGKATDYTATIDWGDGTAVTTATIKRNLLGYFEVRGAHKYTKKGTYYLTIIVTDFGDEPFNINGTNPITLTAKAVVRDAVPITP